MPPTATEPTVLDRLREQRLGKVDAWAKFISERDEARSPTLERFNTDEFKALEKDARDGETDAFRSAEAAFKAASDQREAEITELDEEIRKREDIARRQSEAAAASTGHVTITSEPHTYRKDNARGENSLSYYRDLALVHGPGITLQTGGTRDNAQARLIRHAQEMDVEMPKRAKAREQRANEQFERAEMESLLQRWGKDSPAINRLMDEMRGGGLPYSPFERRVTPNLADGQGGYFSPPIWLIDEFIPGLRAHRIAAGLPRQMDLPPGTSSINIPKLNTLTVVGYQQVNNSGLPSQDWTDTFVQANVKTMGGYSDVALPLLELSPHGVVDEVITVDLMAAHDKFLDGEVIAGDGTNSGQLNGGHLVGIYAPGNPWGTNTVTYTDGSPSAQHMIPGVFGPMASKIARTRFSAENYRVVLHGRRWFFYSCGLDVNGRPLGETSDGGRYNAAALVQSGLQAEGLVGQLPFIANAPVYIDDNVPTNDNTDGGGATRDVAISGLWDDAWLFEDPIRTDVFREVLSGSLGVRFRVYNYAAFLIRYGSSFSVATGSGFAPPASGFGDFF